MNDPKKDFDDTPSEQQARECREEEIEKMIKLLLLVAIFSDENPVEKMMEQREKEE